MITLQYLNDEEDHHSTEIHGDGDGFGEELPVDGLPPPDSFPPGEGRAKDLPSATGCRRYVVRSKEEAGVSVPLLWVGVASVCQNLMSNRLWGEVLRSWQRAS